MMAKIAFLVLTLHIICLLIIWIPVRTVFADQCPPGCAAFTPYRHDKEAIVGIGRPAPAFSLDAVVGTEFKRINLSDYKGKWVVLFFYPMDFTYVCPTEIRGFNTALDAFHKLNAEILGVSVDSKYSHLAWVKRGDLGNPGYPLMSDITREVTKSYGIYDAKQGVAFRGLFIIDPQGILQYQVVTNLAVGRSVDETLRVLEALQTGEMCPLNWKPGQKTLGK